MEMSGTGKSLGMERRLEHPSGRKMVVGVQGS